MATLDELREELGAIDEAILELIAARQAKVKEIGRLKQSQNLPTRNYRQEREVVQRAKAAAKAHDLSPELGEALSLMLIRASLAAQERDKVASEGEGQGQRALVIGGAGLMGRWFCRFLRAQGFAVEVADPAGPVDGFLHREDWSEGPLDHALIVVAAPMPTTNTILHALAELNPPGLVFDIGSLKSPLRSGLTAAREAGLKITSLHPMFGPDTDLLSGRHVIFVDLGVEAANKEAEALFSATMAKRVSMDLESHDRLIAYVLGLSHALNIAFFTVLADSGESAGKLAQLSSTTFDAQLDVARRVARENPALYFEIQHLNDYGTESLSALLYAVERVRSVVRAGDLAAFTRLMERGLAYVEGRGEGS